MAIERAVSFGSVAAAYERYRPGYSDGVVDEVLAYAGHPVRTALEIGAGTGKATRAFAARGIAVTATDPDAAMLDELRRHVPASVTVVQGAFEQLRPSSTFDLVFAAAALHWTQPVGRWERVAELLRPGGTVASFGGQVEFADPAVAEAVRAARSRVLPFDGVSPPDGTPEGATMQWPGTELTRSPLFTDVRQTTVERRFTLSADDYLRHLATVSAYLTLPAAARQDVLDRIRAVLPERVAVVADVVLHLATAAGTPVGTSTA